LRVFEACFAEADGFSKQHHIISTYREDGEGGVIESLEDI
jgi:hypothetical protein